MTASLSPAEAVVRFEALRRQIGPLAYVSVGLSLSPGPALFCTIWPDGLSSMSRIGTPKAYADNLDELLEKVTAAWTSLVDEHRARRIRQMAHEIIRITDDHGNCSAAALRDAGFDDEEVCLLGAAASEQAGHAASLGPFVIQAGSKANGAPSDEAAA